MKKLATAAILAAALPVFAQADDLIDGSNLEAILEVAKGFGTAELAKDVQGDPKIEGRLEGRQYSIFFYDCNEQKTVCDSMMLISNWVKNEAVDLKFVNDWNNRVRYGMASLDADGDVAVSFAVNLKGGISKANLDDTMDIWRSVILRFEAEAQKNTDAK
ncbi:MAG: YbjN domain-containing protein [Cardiobacteriaceae bacterium]|nr:YbjN domain-containing protein [Cardiobacteriaceae bacterium]